MPHQSREAFFHSILKRTADPLLLRLFDFTQQIEKSLSATHPAFVSPMYAKVLKPPQKEKCNKNLMIYIGKTRKGNGVVSLCASVLKPTSTGYPSYSSITHSTQSFPTHPSHLPTLTPSCPILSPLLTLS